MIEKTKTIRQMCDAHDVTPRTLRFYEAKELLFPVREGQKRLFTKRDGARLKLILLGKRFGFSLEELRQWLQIYDSDGSTAQMQAWLPIAQAKLTALLQQKKEISETVIELSKMIDMIKSELP